MLAGVGYGEQEIDSMLERGIAALSWGLTHLPGDNLGQPLPQLDGLIRTADTASVGWIDMEPADDDVFIT